MFLRVIFLLFICSIFTFAGSVQRTEKILPKFEQYIQKNMKKWAIPGLAIAVVSRDKVLMCKGFGTREVGKDKPVNEDTIFEVASLTKNFTASLAGILEAQKVFSLNDRVEKYLPKFKLSSPEITEKVTIRDLMSHCIGLGHFKGDTIMKAGFSAGEVLERLHHIGFELKFREDYSYSNQMFGVAGVVMEEATHKTYEELLQDNIYKPLNMSRSSVGKVLIQKLNSFFNKLKSFFGFEENIALCHDKTPEGEAVCIGLDPLVYVFPGTAGINTTAHDFSIWLQCQLNDGKHAGKQIIPLEHIKAMRKKNVSHNKIKPKDMQFPPEMMTDVGYGMGWFMYDYGSGKTKIHVFEHMGGYTGQRAFVFMCPEHDFAVGILTNLGHFNVNLFPEALRNVFLDMFLDLKERDWSSEYITEKDAYLKKITDRRKAKKLLSPAPKKDNKFYVGTYTNELYGEMKVEETKNKSLKITINGKSCGIVHWNGDEFDLKGWEFSGNMSRTDPHFIEFGSNDKGETICFVTFLDEGVDPIFKKKN